MTRTHGETVRVGGVDVRGLGLDERTRCAHYASERDVVAVEFPCCGSVYPCFACHEALADHEREVWPRDGLDATAVLCGGCGEWPSIRTYLDVLSAVRDGDTSPACPDCGMAFNPGCLDHVDRYVER